MILSQQDWLQNQVCHSRKIDYFVPFITRPELLDWSYQVWRSCHPYHQKLIQVLRVSNKIALGFGQEVPVDRILACSLLLPIKTGDSYYFYFLWSWLWCGLPISYPFDSDLSLPLRLLFSSLSYRFAFRFREQLVYKIMYKIQESKNFTEALITLNPS